MTYLRDDRDAPEGAAPTSGDLPGRRRHSSDHAGSDQYVYQRPADWTPSARRRRRTEAFEDRASYAAPTDAAPVDWWGDSPRSEPAWDEESAARAHWDADHRGEGSAWNAEALSAAAGVPYRSRPPQDGPTDHGTVDFSSFGTDETAPMAPAYRRVTDHRIEHHRVPDQRRPAEETPEPGSAFAAGGAVAADVEVPVAPPAETKRSLPRKHLLLRIAAVLVLVFSAAVGVAVTVLDDTDADTVQVKEDLQADAPAAAASPDSATEAEQEQQQKAAELQAQQKQDAAVESAQSRAADKASAAQKSAAKQAERAEDQRTSRAAATRSAEDDDDSSSSSGGNSGDPVPSAPVDCNSYSGNKKTGCALLSEFGFATSQMSCLEKLWDKESNWRESAQNPSSGAFGIPQALPADKMATVASDYRTNPATQIRWGLGYIKGRYSTPCGAWSHSQANGWY